MTDDQMRALNAYEIALDRLKKSKAGKHSNGLENQYSQAYQRLVTLGLRPQVRGRYR